MMTIFGGVTGTTVPIPTQLGTAQGFSVLSAAASTFSGASTSCNLKSGGATAPGLLIGSQQHYGNATSTQALIDLTNAYDYYKALTPIGNIYLGASTTPIATSPNFAGDIANFRFTPGVFFGGAAITNSISCTFDALGNGDARFVVQIGAAFTPAASSNVILLNGANSANIFWVVTGALNIGATAHIKGTMISQGATSIGDGTTVDGRVMTVVDGAITLSNNAITTTL
jgi:hypothetical protein